MLQGEIAELLAQVEIKKRQEEDLSESITRFKTQPCKYLVFLTSRLDTELSHVRKRYHHELTKIEEERAELTERMATFSARQVLGYMRKWAHNISTHNLG